MESKGSFGLSLLQGYSDSDEDFNNENDEDITSKSNNIAHHMIGDDKNAEEFDKTICKSDEKMDAEPIIENHDMLPPVSDVQSKDLCGEKITDTKLQVNQKTENQVVLAPVLNVQSTNFSKAMQEPIAEFPHSYRETCNISDSSDSESSSDESCLTLPRGVDLNASIDEDDNDGETNRKNASLNSKSKMLEDLGILDLAPLEDLKISVPEEECIPIGVVHNIIDPLIIVSARKGCPAIDLDSVLFLDHGKKFLGQVFDVFGQVSEPMYMVRFNSMQHIIDLGVQVGMEVYFAPRTRHTAYVFVDALFQQKGSDASWENDQEPPEGCLDYSDDEQERRAKAAHRLKKNPRTNSEESTNPCKKRQANKPRRNKVQNYMQQQQAPVNPFYMVPPPGYSPCYPSPSINYTNVAPSIPPMPITSTTEQMILPSPYVYPPPPTQAVDLAQNHLSQPVDLMQNHLSQPADSSPQNLPLQPGDPSQNLPTTSADPTQQQPFGL